MQLQALGQSVPSLRQSVEEAQADALRRQMQGIQAAVAKRMDAEADAGLRKFLEDLQSQVEQAQSLTSEVLSRAEKAFVAASRVDDMQTFMNKFMATARRSTAEIETFASRLPQRASLAMARESTGSVFITHSRGGERDSVDSSSELVSLRISLEKEREGRKEAERQLEEMRERERDQPPAARGERDGRGRRLHTQPSESSSVADQLQSKSQAIRRKEAQVSELSSELARVEAELLSVQRDRDALREELSKRNEKVHSLQSQLQELETDLDAALTRAKTAERRVLSISPRVPLSSRGRQGDQTHRTREEEEEAQTTLLPLPSEASKESQKDTNKTAWESQEKEELLQRIARLESDLAKAVKEGTNLRDALSKRSSRLFALQQETHALMQENVGCHQKIDSLQSALQQAAEDDATTSFRRRSQIGLPGARGGDVTMTTATSSPPFISREGDTHLSSPFGHIQQVDRQRETGAEETGTSPEMEVESGVPSVSVDVGRDLASELEQERREGDGETGERERGEHSSPVKVRLPISIPSAPSSPAPALTQRHGAALLSERGKLFDRIEELEKSLEEKEKQIAEQQKRTLSLEEDLRVAAERETAMTALLEALGDSRLSAQEEKEKKKAESSKERETDAELRKQLAALHEQLQAAEERAADAERQKEELEDKERATNKKEQLARAETKRLEAQMSDLQKVSRDAEESLSEAKKECERLAEERKELERKFREASVRLASLPPAPASPPARSSSAAPTRRHARSKTLPKQPNIKSLAAPNALSVSAASAATSTVLANSCAECPAPLDCWRKKEQLRGEIEELKREIGWHESTRAREVRKNLNLQAAKRELDSQMASLKVDLQSKQEAIADLSAQNFHLRARARLSEEQARRDSTLTKATRAEEEKKRKALEEIRGDAARLKAELEEMRKKQEASESRCRVLQANLVKAHKAAEEEIQALRLSHLDELSAKVSKVEADERATLLASLAAETMLASACNTIAVEEAAENFREKRENLSKHLSDARKELSVAMEKHKLLEKQAASAEERASSLLQQLALTRAAAARDRSELAAAKASAASLETSLLYAKRDNERRTSLAQAEMASFVMQAEKAEKDRRAFAAVLSGFLVHRAGASALATVRESQSLSQSLDQTVDEEEEAEETRLYGHLGLTNSLVRSSGTEGTQSISEEEKEPPVCVYQDAEVQCVQKTESEELGVQWGEEREEACVQTEGVQERETEDASLQVDPQRDEVAVQCETGNVDMREVEVQCFQEREEASAQCVQERETQEAGVQSAPQNAERGVQVEAEETEEKETFIEGRDAVACHPDTDRASTDHLLKLVRMDPPRPIFTSPPCSWSTRVRIQHHQPANTSTDAHSFRTRHTTRQASRARHSPSNPVSCCCGNTQCVNETGPAPLSVSSPSRPSAQPSYSSQIRVHQSTRFSSPERHTQPVSPQLPLTPDPGIPLFDAAVDTVSHVTITTTHAALSPQHPACLRETNGGTLRDRGRIHHLQPVSEPPHGNLSAGGPSSETLQMERVPMFSSSTASASSAPRRQDRTQAAPLPHDPPRSSSHWQGQGGIQTQTLLYTASAHPRAREGDLEGRAKLLEVAADFPRASLNTQNLSGDRCLRSESSVTFADDGQPSNSKL